ncbi:MAG: zf-HC2 domain-containing protein [Planctomycetes bacterium]|nr:zf-HC2 domain-containing protein [Planctomycetota bacterium]
MNCLEFQELLQRRLDGVASPDPPELELHLSTCRPCQERHAAALRLLEGVKNLPRPRTPEHLGKRIVSMVLEDRRLRQRRWRVRVMVTSALAASLLVIALSGYYLLPERKTPGPKAAPEIARKDNTNDAEQPAEIAKSMEDARNAVTALTGRLADETKKQASILLAATGPVDIGPMIGGPEIPANLDQTLRQAGQGLSEGLEPVARSTRRALQFLVREVGAIDTGTQ